MKKFTILSAFILFVPLLVAAQTNLISFKSSWKYLDNGSNQGTAWRSPSFNDTGWNSGNAILGYGIDNAGTIVSYGPNKSNKYITTYFRKAIQVADASAFSSLDLSVLRDDGVVIYINGQEVYRDNMPTGTITYTTLALKSNSGTKSKNIPASALVNGTNVVAVEVHQQKVTSSDLAFDLELKGIFTTPPANQPPTISISSPGNNASYTLGQTVTFSAAASDPEGALAKVEFYVNGGKVGEDATSPYSINWTPSSTGSYSLTAKATDAFGASTTSASVAITVTSGSGETRSGFASVTYLNPVVTGKNTQDKPQSKVWTYAGKWWTILPDQQDTYIWRLDGTTWTKVLKVATSSSSKADCKVVGDVVHALLFRGTNTSYLVSVQYDPATTSYKLWPTRNTRVALDLEPEAETATIDIDGTGRMWLLTDGISNVFARWSDAPYINWSGPISIASGIDDDDICGVIAMPGKVGVFWGNQKTNFFGFKTHADGANPTDWSADELPASQYALNFGAGFADDHMNMAISSNGTLYCAAKTGYETPGQAKLILLIRRPNGTWDRPYTVTDNTGPSENNGTRPIVILNEALDKLKIIYTDVEGGGNIFYKESRISNISFGPAINLFRGTYNYVTSMKQNYTSDIVVLATNEGVSPRQIVGILATDAPWPSLTSARAGISPELNDAAQQEPLMAYPNPFSSRVTISFAPTVSEEYSIALYDSKGAIISELAKGKSVAGELKKFEVDGSGLAGGLYFVRLQTATGVKAIRVVLAK